MLLFLDTEYTGFVSRDLISIGLVSEDGKHEFYAERNDYRKDLENSFVQKNVIPNLRQDPLAICSFEELHNRMSAWFRRLPREVQVACDSMIDRDLLWKIFGHAVPRNLNAKHYDLAPLVDQKVFHLTVCKYHENLAHPWHHALNDAHAHRTGWMAWMAHKQKQVQMHMPLR